MIRNTAADMNNPDGVDRDLLLLTGLTTGSPEAFIETQEKAGQSQLVHSDRLPTKILHCTEADFLALGFMFGDPDPADPIFRPATLPEGWTKQASDHDMWSYVVDTLGRRRVAVFYKAAFYDRSAHMWTESVSSYVHRHGWDGTEIHSDEQWATPEAIIRAAQDAIEQCDKYIEMYSEPPYDEDGFGEREIAKHQAQRARYEALVVRFTTTSNDTPGAQS
jgi:hypothetical protein